jgi:hypothetical protein
MTEQSSKSLRLMLVIRRDVDELRVDVKTISRI